MKKRRPTRAGPLTNIRRDREAWSVYVTREGKSYPGYFSDAVYGGSARSLIAAKRFRDVLLKRIAPDTRVRRRIPRGVKSETGIVGVTLERYLVGGVEYERAVASWQDADGNHVRRRFSTGERGKAKAIALAKEAREQGVALARNERRARQRAEAARRLANEKPMPRQLKAPSSRKGIKMPVRRRA
jgi:hypothetical protein